MRDVIGELGRIRNRGRLLLLTQRISVVLAAAMLTAFVVGLVDYFLRLPDGLRLVLLVGGAGALGWAIARYLAPALWFTPSLTEVALRVERSHPDLAGRLASGIELAAAGAGGGNSFAARSIEDAESRAQRAHLGDVIRPGRTGRNAGMFLAAGALVALVIVLAPGLAQIGAARLFAPWSGAKWPARTAIESLMGDVTVHPRGSALPLRAQATKAPGGKLDALRVVARYRLHVAGSAGDWKEVVLTPQDQNPGLYERLVDTDAEEIEFVFESGDSATATERIVLSPPPAVLSALILVEPPPYAQPHVAPFAADLGPGIDSRSITESPSLVGSTVSLAFTLNKPIPIPADQSARESWLRQALGWSAAGSPLLDVPGDASVLASSFSLQWTLEETVELHLELIDEHGLGSVEEIVYRINAAEDALPSITMTEPESDQSVLASAVVPLAAEARDDVAVRAIGLEAMLAPRTDSAGDAAILLWRDDEETLSSASSIARELDLSQFQLRERDMIEVVGIAEDVYALNGAAHEPARSPARRLRIISDREFGEALFQELKELRHNAIRLEGQQAELQHDVSEDGVQPGVQRAQERIGERLAEQIEALRRLAERRDLNRFEDGQLDALITQSEDILSHAGRASNRAIEEIDSREGQDGATADETDETQEESGTDPRTDEQSDGEQGQAEGERPENHEGGAQQETDELAQAGQDPPELENAEDAAGEPETTPEEEVADQPGATAQAQEPEDQPIVDAQQMVRDELRDLIQLLDDNEDTWVMSQQIRDLLDAQTALQNETRGLSDQTMGRSPEQLDAVELTELDRIDQRQRELADEMRDLIDELRRRADDMEEIDPQAAAGQRAAANTAEEREIDRNMEDAARSASQNQLQNAQNSQQRAREGLERMQQDLDRKRARAEDLERRLESLVESIKRLVTVQESEIAALDGAIHEGDFAGRDRAMIRLHQNTQAVSGEARAAGREADRIARSLDRAADAQSAAIAALRAAPVLGDDARAGEARSLEMLREALAVAEEMEEQLEEDIVRQRRDELIQAYRELAERETALRGRTLDLASLEEFDRRALVEARMQSSAQEEIRTAVSDVQARTADLGETVVFSHAHAIIDEWSAAVSTSLREGNVSADVTDQQKLIAESLGRLAQALEEEQAEQSEFEDGSGGGSGEGGGQQGQQGEQPLVPPLSELKLLRGLQEQIYNQTRDIDGRSDIEAASRRQRLRELQRQQDALQRLGEQLLEQLAPPQPTPEGAPPEGGPQ
jgi:hypothetical protein